MSIVLNSWQPPWGILGQSIEEVHRATHRGFPWECRAIYASCSLEEPEDELECCKGPILFDLVSYCDVRVQSNPFVLKETSV